MPDAIMEGNASIGRRQGRRHAPWSIAGLLLLLPFLAMQLTDEVAWGPGDFIILAALLFGACAVYELAARRSEDRAYRAAVGVALGTAFLLVWINLAVGIIGSEHDAANLLYAAVLAVGVVGAFAARMRPVGLARAMATTAAAQLSVVVIAWLADMGSPGPNVVLGGAFTILWMVSAGLFHKATDRDCALAGRDDCQEPS